MTEARRRRVRRVIYSFLLAYGVTFFTLKYAPTGASLALLLVIGVVGLMTVGWAAADIVWTKRTFLWLKHLELSFRNVATMTEEEFDLMPSPLELILSSHNYYLRVLPLRTVLRAKMPEPEQ